MEPFSFHADADQQYGVVVRVCTNPETVRLALDLDDDDAAREIMCRVTDAAEDAFGIGCVEDRPSFRDWNGGPCYRHASNRHRGLSGVFVVDFYTSLDGDHWTPDPQAGAVFGMLGCAKINEAIE